MRLKPLLIVPAALALLAVAYLLAGPYLDRRAIRQANEFCSQVLVGESIYALRAKAEKNRSRWRNGRLAPAVRNDLLSDFQAF